ncbi:MAG: hypothetical protein JGK30_12415 [Microcoleus sp. PH2017_40_RAT_O_B]|nr:hypothetical protein [Microcoleus sp. PH2017_34_RAT_O_A]MCC3610280.1 hypothetical protein [Microcoleus sp. PH2017_40_RAT_O_B]
MLTYKDRLCCWAIARLLPSGQWIIVARFRDRSDAEGHFKFLRQTIPHAQFDVVFDLSRQSNRLSALANSANSLTSRL